ncbi:SAM-dependent methyltransferase [Nocardia sp. NPDC052001]|uniref:SAM-dependent methyltransferase n=1 Tax=Nocardia sp. NPDC052001 TaxID=3154853 RepID=UPI003417966E
MADGIPVDQSKPSIARVYDYLLGGKDNYAADRAVGDYFKNDLPGSVAIAFSNRQALIRAVHEMTRLGITQFLDMGSGLPTADNVHQVAKRLVPDARVVYVDNDPIVLTHGRALLATDASTQVIQADLHDPADIRQHREVKRLIDFDRPIGVIFSATLHHLQDEEKPAEVVRFWAEQAVPDSLFYISHFRSGHNAETQAAEQMLQATFGRGRWRTEEEIEDLFGELEVLEPGLVPCARWKTGTDTADVPRIGSGPMELTVWEQLIACGMARKR